MNRSSFELRGLAASFAFHALLIASLFFGLFSGKDNQISSISFAVTVDEISSSLSSDISSKAQSARKIKTKNNTIPHQLAQSHQGEKVEEKIQIKEQSKIAQLGKEKTNSIAHDASFSKDSKASYDASYLNNPSLEYPPLSRSLEEEGIVTLKVLVSSDGNAKSVLLQSSSGYRRLDNAAIESVKKWKFAPAIIGGSKAESWIAVPVKFLLDKVA